MTTLTGKTALVTGGSRGIGAAIVRRLAREGATVAFTYASSEAKAQELVAQCTADQQTVAAYRADQADPQQVAAFVEAAHARFGMIDIVVNSAGIHSFGIMGHRSWDPADAERIMAVNVGGVVATVQAALPRMNDGGRIISIGTSGVHLARYPGVAAYVASKSALTGYTKAWAHDLGRRGITVNVIQPGPIDTDMNPLGSPFAAKVVATTALGRYGAADEIAGAVAFLAGPDAAYITGVSLPVDGGQLA